MGIMQESLGNSCPIFKEIVREIVCTLYFLALEAENLPVVFV